MKIVDFGGDFILEKESIPEEGKMRLTYTRRKKQAQRGKEGELAEGKIGRISCN